MRPVFLFAIYAVAFAGVTIFRATADANNPAHDLAQKFATGDHPKPAAVSEATPVAKPQINAQPEIQPKTVAKPAVAPAVAKPVAKSAPAKTEFQAQAPSAAPTATPASKAPVAAAAPAAKPRPPAPGPDYEKDMLEAARAEAEARQKVPTKVPTQQAAQQAESKPADVVPVPTTAAAPPTVTPAATPPTTAQPAPAQVAAPAAEPKPKAVEAPIKVEALITTPDAIKPPSITRPDGAPRASILVVLTNHTQAGRRVTPPDPIICLADICYVSEGAYKDARVVSRADALSTKNTIMAGAGACKGTTRCAFRGVSMKPGDEIQIVDLGLAGHDKREPADMEPDKTCHMDGEFLACERPTTAPDYRIWAVPESIANAAGPAAIEAALADDLPEEDVADAGDK